MFSLYDKFSPCIIKFLNTTIYTGWMENHTHTHTSIVKFFMTKQLFWLQKISLNSTLVLGSSLPAPGLQRRTTRPHGSWCSHWLLCGFSPWLPCILVRALLQSVLWRAHWSSLSACCDLHHSPYYLSLWVSLQCP